ncbi:hypothetical protein [Mycobacterium sp.]|uniref:hypothetical protein n=1 Tax=Mycobacterium sp. TaxID=1785 RepID=UPI0025FEB8CC|nr:hypothetical protein [Mycobacterium sp.]
MTTKSPIAVAGLDQSTRDRADPPEFSGTPLTRSTVGVTKATIEFAQPDPADALAAPSSSPEYGG